MISVVIPSYKAQDFIQQTISSVLSDKSIVKEIIVVEDGVFDETANKISDFGNIVKHIQLTKNVGAQKARNIGLLNVSTEFVMFLDSDDYVKPGFLLGLFNAIKNGSGSDLALGKMEFEGGSHNGKIFIPPSNETSISLVKRWLSGNPGPHPCGVLWSTSFINELGGWNQYLVKNQDGEMIIRAGLRGARIAISLESSCVYVNHEGPRVSKNSTRLSIESQELIYRIVDEYLAVNNDLQLRESLNQFQYFISVNSFEGGHKDLGLLWERCWRKSVSFKSLWRQNGFLRFVRLIASYFFGIEKVSKVHAFYHGIKYSNKECKCVTKPI